MMFIFHKFRFQGKCDKDTCSVGNDQTNVSAVIMADLTGTPLESCKSQVCIVQHCVPLYCI